MIKTPSYYKNEVILKWVRDVATMVILQGMVANLVVAKASQSGNKGKSSMCI